MNEIYKLRPCPMCGSTDIKHYTTESGQSFRRGTAKCKRCGCTVRAEGGGHKLFAQLGIKPNDNGRYSTADYEAVRRESNERAYRLSAARWNGEVSTYD